MTELENERVLVIEDDPDARDGLCDLLKMDGYHVETAADLGDVRRRSDLHEFALIVLDRKLPDDPHETALPYLRQRAPEAATAVVTGFDDLHGAVSAIRHGAHEYLLKPVDGELTRLRLGALIERRRNELARRESDELLRTIIHASPLAIATLDGQDNVQAWNASAERLFGWAADEVLGQPLPVIGRGSEDGAALSPPEKDGTSRHGVELQRLRKDGELLDVALWTARVGDERSKRARVVCFYVDISSRKRAERKLLQSQRMAAIGETMRGLTHECRNALQRSFACMEMLEIELLDRPAALELLGRLQQSHQDLHRLYEEVVAYASPIRLNLAPCNLGDLWRDVWKRLECLHQQKQIALREEPADLDLNCTVDHDALGRALQGILENAIGAAPDLGQVIVAAHECRLNLGSALRMSFRDNGAGIDAEPRERIFEPFYTTKTRGLGLGLTVAKRIVESHGGRIEIGEANPGAEIVITLPRESG